MKRSEFLKSASRVLVMPLVIVMTCGTVSAESLSTDVTESPKSYQIHGFASQGYLLTDNNNFYGDSQGGGSLEYYELGLNGIWQLGESWSVSGQLLARDAGATDDGKLRIDYLFTDYRFISMNAAHAGVRLGRVKNPIGFYNESRDVLFTRPSILLPQSVYLEGIGIRELLFSSDGLQFYSDWDHEQHHTSFKMNFAKSDEVSKQTRKNFLGGTGGSGQGGAYAGFTLNSLRITDMFFAQLMDEFDGGRMRFGLSYLSATLNAQLESPQLPAPLDIDLDSNIIVLSGQYNQEFWSLTSEYALTTTKFNSSGQGERSRSEGLYLQGQYRMTPEWTGLLRYDLSFADRNDRGSTDARDVTAGLDWSPNQSWVVMGEYHYIHGSNAASSIPGVDNPEGVSKRTNMLVMMVGYRF